MSDTSACLPAGKVIVAQWFLFVRVPYHPTKYDPAHMPPNSSHVIRYTRQTATRGPLRNDFTPLAKNVTNFSKVLVLCLFSNAFSSGEFSGHTLCSLNFSKFHCFFTALDWKKHEKHLNYFITNLYHNWLIAQKICLNLQTLFTINVLAAVGQSAKSNIKHFQSLGDPLTHIHTHSHWHRA